MKIFYRIYVDGNEVLGSDSGGFCDRYKSLNTFFRYFMTWDFITDLLKNAKEKNKDAKKIEFKIFEINGNVYDEKSYVLRRKCIFNHLIQY